MFLNIILQITAVYLNVLIKIGYTYYNENGYLDVSCYAHKIELKPVFK